MWLAKDKEAEKYQNTNQGIENSNSKLICKNHIPASNGREALDLIQNNNIRLVVEDHLLPSFPSILQYLVSPLGLRKIESQTRVPKMHETKTSSFMCSASLYQIPSGVNLAHSKLLDLFE